MIRSNPQVFPHELGDRAGRSAGIHCLLDLYDCPVELLNNKSFILQALRAASIAANSTLLEEVSYHFHPQGITAVVLLAESHISIHTWPEKGYAAVDVFTCGQHTQPMLACKYLIRILQADQHSLIEIPRWPLSPKPFRKSMV